jgi:hypothetical protein
VTLIATTTIEAADPRSASLALARRLPGGAAARERVAVEALDAVETDPETLRPDRAWSRVTVASPDDAGEPPRIEQREDRFDWANAEGCK